MRVIQLVRYEESDGVSIVGDTISGDIMSWSRVVARIAARGGNTMSWSVVIASVLADTQARGEVV